MATHKFVGDVGVTSNIKSSTTDASLYNLGAYDSVVDNGDGTVTITRQTGYIQLNGSEDWGKWYQEDKYYLLISVFPNQPSAGNKPSLAVCNVGYTYRNIWDGNLSFDICANPNSGPWTEPAIAFRNDSIDSIADWKNYVANHPITIEYHIPSASGLVYTEIVIKDRPLSQLSAEGGRYVKRLYDKSTNLFNMDSMRQFYYIAAEDGECLYDPNYDYEYGSDIYIPVNGRYISFTFDTRPNSNYLEYVSRFYRVGCYAKTGSFISRLSGVPNTATLTLSLPDGTKYIRLSVNKPSASSYTFMLNEGSQALPYEPYDTSGHIAHPEAKLLLDEYEKTKNLFDGVIVTPHSGWQDYGYLEVEPNTAYTISNCKEGTNNNAVVFYSSSMSNLGYVRFGSTGTFTTPADTKYLLCQLDDTTTKQYMLNKGSVALPYVPFHGPIVHEGDAGVLLWQNATPNAAFFAAQTITVADMSAYKWLAIVYKNYYASGVAWSVHKFRRAAEIMPLSCNAGSATENFSCLRILEPSSNNVSVAVQDCYKERTVDNQRLVPVAIYGTNIL